MAGKDVSQEYGAVAFAIMVAAVIFSAAFYFAPPKTAQDITYSPAESFNYSLTKFSTLADSPRLIYASAEASKDVEPDKADIVLSVVSKGEDPSAIQAENDARTRKVKAAILALGVPEANIKTVGYELNRMAEYNKTTQAYETTGYRLANSMHVTSYDVSLAGRIVKTAVSEGANEVTSVSFGLTDAARKATYATLLAQASLEAKDKAGLMASATGVKIIGLSTMSEGYSIAAVLSSYKDAVTGAMPPPQDVSISAGLIKVTATVNVGYEIE
ncbi:MAG: SIMPL domain-containing protein [Candidatus Micrarchaeia archaeon]